MDPSYSLVYIHSSNQTALLIMVIYFRSHLEGRLGFPFSLPLYCVLVVAHPVESTAPRILPAMFAEHALQPYFLLSFPTLGLLYHAFQCSMYGCCRPAQPQSPVVAAPRRTGEKLNGYSLELVEMFA